MKKIAPSIFIALFALILLSAFTIIRSPENADNSRLKPDVMNCTPGMYKTYDEFINNKPHQWKWVSVEIGYSFNMNFNKYLIVFKDENGQKQKLSPSEFWGWRDPDGVLYRNSAFVNGKITAIPFSVSYVAKDFVMYYPPGFRGGNTTGVSIKPDQWCSKDLNSPIMDPEEYFKKQDKNVLNKILTAMEDCSTKRFKDLYSNQTPDRLVIPDNDMKTCMKNCPEIVSIWVWTKKDLLSGDFTKGSYQK